MAATKDTNQPLLCQPAGYGTSNDSQPVGTATATASACKRDVPRPAFLSVRSLDSDEGGISPASATLHPPASHSHVDASSMSSMRGGISSRSCVGPGPLHHQPPAIYPTVVPAKTELNPRDISHKFFTKHGAKDVDWRRVRSCNSVPFPVHPGMSEANLFHSVIDVAKPSFAAGDGAHDGGMPHQHGRTKSSPLQRVKELFTPTGGPSSASRRFHALPGGASSNDVRCSTGSASHHEEDDKIFPVFSSFDVRDGSSSYVQVATAEDAATTGCFDGLLGTSGANTSSTRSSAIHYYPHQPRALKSSPPSLFVIKHYDTSVVETPSMALRLLRHLTNTTNEKLMAHEVFFYSKIAPFLGGEDTSAFRVPKLYFAALLNRGEPGILKYVCCKSGSGSVATLALEDMSRSGFTFNHERDDGLYDEECITSVLFGLAHLHSSFWDRCSEPYLKDCDPATIPRCVHRMGNSLVEKMSHFRAINLHTTVFRRWKRYPPMLLLKCEEVQRTLVRIQRYWKDIRELAVAIVMRNDTYVHGDCHYRNMGFQRIMEKERASKHRRQSSAVGPTLMSMAEDTTMRRHASHDNMHGGSLERQESGFAGEGGSTAHVQTCFLDFQSSGPGSAAAELVYFICTSVPVEVSWNEVDTMSHCGGGSSRSEREYSSQGDRGRDGDTSSVSNVSFSRARKSSAASLPVDHAGHTPFSLNSSQPVNPATQYGSQFSQPPSERSMSNGPALPKSASVDVFGADGNGNGTRNGSNNNIHATNNTSSSGAETTSIPTLGASAPPTSIPANNLLLKPPKHPEVREPQITHHTSATAMSFRELYEYDVGLLHQYYQALDGSVKANFPFERLVDEVYTIVRHWAGTIVIDMVNGTVEDRLTQKKNLQIAKLLEWSEHTAQRVLWMCTAAYVYERGELGSEFDSTPSQTSRSQAGVAQSPASLSRSPVPPIFSPSANINNSSFTDTALGSTSCATGLDFVGSQGGGSSQPQSNAFDNSITNASFGRM